MTLQSLVLQNLKKRGIAPPLINHLHLFNKFIMKLN